MRTDTTAHFQMSIDDFYTFWKSKGAEVTTSRHTSDSCHYFVRSYNLYKRRLTSYGEMVKRLGISAPICLVYTEKEIRALTLADLTEHYVGRQLEVAFGS